MIYLGLIPAVAFIDRQFKDDVEARGKDELPYDTFSDRVTITKAHNKGMSMNFLEERPDVVLKIHLTETALFSLWYLPTLFKKGEVLKKLGGALALGGALGNLSDRFTRGYVVDYILIKKWPFNKMIMNLSDIGIASGAVLSAAHVLLDSYKKAK